ncbi:MAG TPA: S8 family peptidase [Candidatus Kapabacteria bacterium]|mgnify:CR=1 FL=1|nr:S8 family peptidase [Candidatus Kapabacteria bacterium]
MKKINTLLLLLLISIPLLANEEIPTKRIIVKFNENSKYLNLLSENNVNQLEEFYIFFKNNKIRPLISENTMTALHNKAFERNKNNNYTQAAQNHLYSLLSSISRIFLIEYSSGAEENIIVGKLKNNPEIEYAEILPERNLFFKPNDTDIDKQYYLNLTQCFDAWDLLNNESVPLVAIVDTGVDYYHEDLASNIFTNLGETGIDNNGVDKRVNGIDDDGNGFIDDYRGWDFVSSDEENGDNDPKPGNPHGTHVAGIVGGIVNNAIGIAGTAFNVRLLPVKIGSDNSNSTSTDKSYEGILYAASMGADVINCSWGGPIRSNAENEIIQTATALGSLVVAAAGNDNSEVYYYPASYPDVISVAYTDESDFRSNYSNYNYSVDVSAPGVSIYSTLPNNSYGYMDGTSMAAPVVSGIAAMVRNKYPELSPVQVIEHIKNNTDNIDEKNPFYNGVLGTGRVNAFKSLSNDIKKSIIVKDYYAVDINDDSLLLPGEEVNVYFNFLNVLKAVGNARVEASAISFYEVEFTNTNLELGTLMSMEEKSFSTPISFIVPTEVDFNYVIYLKIKIYDYDQLINTEYIPINVNPNYKTMSGNNISVTFNSIGNLAYNDYPSNNQGDGFNYKSSMDLLYEGSLLVARSEKRISNVARGSNQNFKDESFKTYERFDIKNPGDIAAFEGYSSFKDKKIKEDAGVDVIQKVYQFNDAGREDFIILCYDIINSSESNTDSIYVGLFFDWDIGPSGLYNFVNFDFNYGFGYIRNIRDTTLPWIGVNMLSANNINFFAIDNDGWEPGNPGIYDGFSNSKKWYMMTDGISRKKSNVTDVSMLISAGPIRLNIGDTANVAFSIFCGKNLNELRYIDTIVRRTAIENKIADGSFEPLPRKLIISSVTPNPVQEGSITIKYEINNNAYINLDIYDSFGNLVKNIFSWDYQRIGRYEYQFNTDYLSHGAYLIVLRNAFTSTSYFFVKCR